MRFFLFLLCCALAGFLVWYSLSHRSNKELGKEPDPIAELPLRKEDIQPGDLVQAILKREYQKAQTLLDLGANPNDRNKQGDTALLFAVNNGELPLIRRLLTAGADPLARGNFGFPPLHWAAKQDLPASCSLLLEMGVPVNSRDIHGDSALHLAAQQGNLQCLELLLHAGAAVNQPNIQGETPLMLAVKQQKWSMIEPLIAAGADPEQPDKAGKTPLSQALELDGARWFLSGEVSSRIPDIRTRLDSILKISITNLDQKPALNIEDLEQETHRQINRVRKEHGLRPLNFEPALQKIARSHSQDMGTRDFFNHINPEGEGPSARARRAGYPLERDLGASRIQTGIGENIYMGYLFAGNSAWIQGDQKMVTYDWFSAAQLVQDAVQGWMDSPGHRANILNPGYIRQGLGVAITEDGRIYFTQNLQ